jgi:myo-inositol catabolism protein IolS
VEQRRFGDTDLVCSALGFGTWEMSTTQYGQIDVSEAAAAVNSAIDNGITLVDTAAVYGPFHSEILLAKALGSRRKEVVLVSKVGFAITEGGKSTGRDSSRMSVIWGAEGCLRRLNTDYLDLLLIHWPDTKTPFAETIGALEELKTQGKIRHYGVSNFTPEMMEECGKHGKLAANQVGYNLFDRRMESRVFPYCQEHGIGFMAYGTLGFGLLTGAFTEETRFVDWDWRSSGNAFGLPVFQRYYFLRELKVVERLKGLAARYGKTVPQLAIAWNLRQPVVSVSLVGARKPSEVEENVKAVDWKLPEEALAEIDRIFKEEGVPTHVESPQAV